MAKIPIDAEPDSPLTYAERLESRLAMFSQGFSEVPTNHVDHQTASLINSLDPLGSATRKGEEFRLPETMRVALCEDIQIRGVHEIHYYKIDELMRRIQNIKDEPLPAVPVNDQFSAVYGALEHRAWRRN